MFSNNIEAGRATPELSPTRPMPISRSTSSSWSWSTRDKKIKSLIPHRRRSYNHETGTPTIDLSRSSAEHEDLGIYTSLDDSDRSSPENNIYCHGPQGRRSTSSRSPRRPSSTMDMNNRQSYVHPMRQAPRPFTPIVRNSASRHQAINEDDDDVYFPSHYVTSHDLSTYYIHTSSSTSPDRQALSPRQQHEQQSSEQKLQQPSICPPSSPSPKLVSRPRSMVLSSPQNLSPKSTEVEPGYSRENGHFVNAVVGAISSTSNRVGRGSFDVSMLRSKHRASSYHSNDNDFATRAAAVQAARQAFEDREAAKDRKIENAMRKAHERERRKQQQQRRQSRKESIDHVPSFYDVTRSVSISSNSSRRDDNDVFEEIETTYCCGARRMLRRISLRNLHYSRRSSDSDSMSCSETSSPWTYKRSKRTTHNPKDSYFLFLTWMRTRMFKLGRRLQRQRTRKFA